MENKRFFFYFLKIFLHCIEKSNTKKPSGKIKSEYFHHSSKKNIGKNYEYDSKFPVP